MATPWPDKPCPHCQQVITDLLSEMVHNSRQATPEYAAIVGRKPGGAITCPYCQGSVEYSSNGEDLVPSDREPLRYSRSKMEERAAKFGQAFMASADTIPEEWVRVDRGMPGALRGYKYWEDLQP